MASNETTSVLPALMAPIHLAISAAIFSFALHTTSQRLRLFYLPAFLLFSTLSLTSSRHFRFSPALLYLWSQSVTLNILHVVSLLYIERWPAPPKPSTAENLPSRVGWKMATTWRVWSNPRFIRVQKREQDDAFAQDGARRRLRTFIFLQALKVGMYFLVHVYFLPMALERLLGEITPGDVGRRQERFFRRIGEVTTREVEMRAYHAVSWIWESLVYLDGANGVLAIVFTLTGIDEPADWPPLFGRINSATSLRKFWSSFWHRLALRPYRNHGRVVAGGLLGFEDGSILYNAIVAFVVFALSGATHAVVSWNAGRADWYLDIGWFLLNFTGCTVEMVFMACVRRLAKQMGLSRQLQKLEGSWIGRTAGYVSVWGFFFWSVPKWRYAPLRQQAQGLKMQRFLARLEAIQRRNEEMSLPSNAT